MFYQDPCKALIQRNATNKGYRIDWSEWRQFETRELFR